MHSSSPASGIFSTVFDGGGFTISNLRITNASQYGIGLFGVISGESELRNINLVNVNIESASGAVGGLVGNAYNATISNVNVSVGKISGLNSVGALAGYAGFANITSAIARAGSLVASEGGSSVVGGLAGYASNGRFVSVKAYTGNISGEDNLGGLLGLANQAQISFAEAYTRNIDGNDNLGGLVGNGDSLFFFSPSGLSQLTQISKSLAYADSISGRNNLGGLAGLASNAEITSTNAFIGELVGETNIGGLVGGGAGFLTSILSSSAVTARVYGTENVAGLIADVSNGEVAGSMSISSRVTNGGGGAAGGLAGRAVDAIIGSSGAFVFRLVSFGGLGPPHYSGGLAGLATRAEMRTSLAVTSLMRNPHPNIGGLIGWGEIDDDPYRVVDSFWQNTTTFTQSAPPILHVFDGESQTEDALKSPQNSDFRSGIYARWADDWCNPSTGIYRNIISLPPPRLCADLGFRHQQ